MALKPSAKGKPNIRMVAERAQLSPATVSLALRGSESIAAETRARVLEVAREMNYTPVVRNNRSTRSDVRDVLFVTKDFGDRPVTSNPFYGEILNAAEQEAALRGARVSFTLLPDTEPAADSELPSIFSAYKPDGVLLVGAYPATIVEHAAERARTPLVLVDNLVPGIACDSIMADDFGGAWTATQHLIDLGHQHIGMIAGSMEIPSFEARYRGYRAACLKAGLPAADPIETTWNRPALRTALERVLAAGPRPTAIFCMTDAFAVFAMELLRDFGLQVPDDISVVGFDNLPIARMAHPPLTTIHNHPEEMGRLAIRRLLARLEGETSPALSITVSTQLITRDSTRRV